MSNSSVPTGEGARALADRGDYRSADGTRGWPGRHVHRSVLRYFARTDCSGALRDPRPPPARRHRRRLDHLDPPGRPRPARADHAGRGRLGPARARGGHGEAARRAGLRRHRADARRAATGRRLRGGPPVLGGRRLRGRPRARDPVPRREAAGRHGRRWARPGRGRDRRARAGGRRRLSPAVARAAPGGPRAARRQPGPPRDGALERRDAAARVVASRGGRRRPGHRAGHPSLRPCPIPRRRGRGRGRRVAPRDPGDAARLGRRRRQRDRPALRHGRRGDVREHAPPVEPRSSRSRSAPTGR